MCVFVFARRSHCVFLSVVLCDLCAKKLLRAKGDMTHIFYL